MNYKEKGEEALKNENYKEYYEYMVKYHEDEQNSDSKKCLAEAKKKYDLYLELVNFSKIDENDYYKVLNISKKASQKEIRDSYTKLITRYHPDRTKIKESNNVSRIIQKAYSVLSDEKKRKEYDRDLNSSFHRSTNRFVYHGVDNPFEEIFNRRFHHFENDFLWNIGTEEEELFRTFFRNHSSRRIYRADISNSFIYKLVAILLIIFFLTFV